MHRFAPARLSLHFFRFDVDRLFDFVEAALLLVAVTRNVGGDLELLAVGVRLNAGIEAKTAGTGLHVERAGQEQSSQR
jgi:hypothetical protein